MKTHLRITHLGITHLKIRLALALFAFALAASVGANAGTDACKRCEQNYNACLSSGTDESKCWNWYLDCLRYGNGQWPCPMPR